MSSDRVTNTCSVICHRYMFIHIVGILQSRSIRTSCHYISHEKYGNVQDSYEGVTSELSGQNTLFNHHLCKQSPTTFQQPSTACWQIYWPNSSVSPPVWTTYMDEQSLAPWTHHYVDSTQKDTFHYISNSPSSGKRLPYF